MKKFYFFCFITIIIFFPLFSSNADTFSNCQDSCLEACNGFTADYPDQGSCIEPDVNECQFQCASDCMAGGFTTYTEVQDSVFNICSGTVQEGEYITDCPAQCEIECMDNSSCTLTDLDGCINSCGSSCTNDSTTPAELTTIVSNYCIDEDIEVSGGSSTIATTTYETEELSNPIGATSVVEIVGNVTQALLALLGAASLIVFIYGGIMMMTAAGNEERVKKAKSTLIWAVLGIAIILASYSILEFVFDIFTPAS